LHAVAGALLLVDGRGRPVEFVHNRVEVPSGFLWPEDLVTGTATVALCHSLFEACKREPDLLLCLPALGSRDFCRIEIAPTIPFAQVVLGDKDKPASLAWLNDAPGPGMGAHALQEELMARNLVVEPFGRVLTGIREAYPEESWGGRPDAAA
jgi:hypothetical protein